MSPDNPSKKENKSKEELIKENDVYKALEAMITLEVSNLSELIKKQKSSKTKTSRQHFDKKINKKRDKVLQYMFQLDRLTKGEVQEVLAEIEKENQEEEDS